MVLNRNRLVNELDQMKLRLAMTDQLKKAHKGLRKIFNKGKDKGRVAAWKCFRIRCESKDILNVI